MSTSNMMSSVTGSTVWLLNTLGWLSIVDDRVLNRYLSSLDAEGLRRSTFVLGGLGSVGALATALSIALVAMIHPAALQPLSPESVARAHRMREYRYDSDVRRSRALGAAAADDLSAAIRAYKDAQATTDMTALARLHELREAHSASRESAPTDAATEAASGAQARQAAEAPLVAATHRALAAERRASAAERRASGAEAEARAAAKATAEAEARAAAAETRAAAEVRLAARPSGTLSIDGAMPTEASRFAQLYELLGLELMSIGDLDEAARSAESSAEINRRLYGPDHENTRRVERLLEVIRITRIASPRLGRP